MASRALSSVTHLLIVHDDEQFVRVARSCVNDLGWTSTCFAEGAELLSWLDSRLEPIPPRSLVLSDLRRLHGGGVRLVQELRLRGVDIPAVLVTDCLEDRVCDLLRLRGARYVLFKPVELASLQDVLLAIARLSDGTHRLTHRDVGSAWLRTDDREGVWRRLAR